MFKKSHCRNLEFENCELFVLWSIGFWNLSSLRNVGNYKDEQNGLRKKDR
jgi:hypothetical protein